MKTQVVSITEYSKTPWVPTPEAFFLFQTSVSTLYRLHISLLSIVRFALKYQCAALDFCL
jgi:hypothetical protein